MPMDLDETVGLLVHGIEQLAAKGINAQPHRLQAMEIRHVLD
jgi:hypothetical protein